MRGRHREGLLGGAGDEAPWGRLAWCLGSLQRQEEQEAARGRQSSMFQAGSAHTQCLVPPHWGESSAKDKDSPTLAFSLEKKIQISTT